MPTFPSPQSYLRSIGGGTSLNGIPWIDIDLTDGSWTLTDPDSLVQSVTHSNGLNTVTWNELNPQSDTSVGRHYNWAQNYDRKAPRWHKNLVVEGYQLTVRDYIMFTAFMENDDSVNDFNSSVVLATGRNLVSNAVGDNDIAGGYLSKLTNNAAAAYGALQYTGQTSSNTSGPDAGVISSFQGGRARGSGVYHTLKPGVTPFETRLAGSRNSNQLDRPATDTVKIVVGVGIRSNSDSVALNDQQRFKLRYNVVKLTL